MPCAQSEKVLSSERLIDLLELGILRGLNTTTFSIDIIDAFLNFHLHLCTLKKILIFFFSPFDGKSSSKRNSFNNIN